MQISAFIRWLRCIVNLSPTWWMKNFAMEYKILLNKLKGSCIKVRVIRFSFRFHELEFFLHENVKVLITVRDYFLGTQVSSKWSTFTFSPPLPLLSPKTKTKGISFSIGRKMEIVVCRTGFFKNINSKTHQKPLIRERLTP